MIAGPQDYTITEAARELGETRSLTRALLNAGTLERAWDRHANEWRVTADSVARYLAARDAEVAS